MTLATLAFPLALGVGAVIGWFVPRDRGWPMVAAGLALCAGLWLLTDPLASNDGALVFSTSAMLYAATSTGVRQLRPSP
ncbi:hypothetical protein QE364_002560 [Nocardioides zeae]|uniref:Uncharacterized protein n=1 Tax=Nocardioides zeae TaxID=1457234 RepID=A0ACC6IJA6_9ACTN|nr:hypothetical protein [Nocardioides zeae]MDR6173435.1 hypothetical protein [Nocardioides zeae]MDR6210841.1 hypothetical protein [Nocardioides zeae]